MPGPAHPPVHRPALLAVANCTDAPIDAIVRLDGHEDHLEVRWTIPPGAWGRNESVVRNDDYEATVTAGSMTARDRVMFMDDMASWEVTARVNRTAIVLHAPGSDEGLYTEPPHECEASGLPPLAPRPL